MQPGASDKPINNHHPIYSLDRADSHLPSTGLARQVVPPRFLLRSRDCRGEGGSGGWASPAIPHTILGHFTERAHWYVMINHSIKSNFYPPPRLLSPHSFISPLFHCFTPLKLLSVPPVTTPLHTHTFSLRSAIGRTLQHHLL